MLASRFCAFAMVLVIVGCSSQAPPTHYYRGNFATVASETSTDVTTDSIVISCPPGFRLIEGRCVIATVCSENARMQDKTCIVSPSCVEPAVLKDSQCVLPSFCEDGTAPDPQQECPTGTLLCPEHSHKNSSGECIALAKPICPSGSTQKPEGCVVTEMQCPPGSQHDATTQTCLFRDVHCPDKTMKNADNQCILTAMVCPAGSKMNAQEICVIQTIECANGATTIDASGTCILPSICPPGTHFTDSSHQTCVIDLDSTRMSCLESTTFDPTTGKCIVEFEQVKCPVGTKKDPATQKCVIDTQAIECQNGSLKNSANQCIIFTCPPNSSILNAVNECVGVVTCAVGDWDPSLKRCR